MSRRDDTVPMRHMLDHAREAVAIGESVSEKRGFEIAWSNVVRVIRR